MKISTLIYGSVVALCLGGHANAQTGGEYFLDSAGDEGTGTSFSLVVGDDFRVVKDLWPDVTSGLLPGRHTLYWRVQVDGEWSALMQESFTINAINNQWGVSRTGYSRRDSEPDDPGDLGTTNTLAWAMDYVSWAGVRFRASDVDVGNEGRNLFTLWALDMEYDALKALYDQGKVGGLPEYQEQYSALSSWYDLKGDLLAGEITKFVASTFLAGRNTQVPTTKSSGVGVDGSWARYRAAIPRYEITSSTNKVMPSGVYDLWISAKHFHDDDWNYGAFNQLIAGLAIDDADSDSLIDNIDFVFDIDNDSDGLSNQAELQAGTDPLSSDTDGDGMSDRYEVDNGLNAFSNDSALDPDQDGYTNLEEFLAGTDPNDAASIPSPVKVKPLPAWMYKVIRDRG